jgi:hypothetical protein
VLESQDPGELYDLARDLCRFTSDLGSARWSGVPGPTRDELKKQCTSRALQLLVQATDRGFNDIARIKSDEFSVLSRHPYYMGLLGRLKQSGARPSK